jgi:hypothetical protein
LKKIVENILDNNKKDDSIFKKFENLRNETFSKEEYKIYSNASTPEVLGEMLPNLQDINNENQYSDRNPIFLVKFLNKTSF